MNPFPAGCFILGCVLSLVGGILNNSCVLCLDFSAGVGNPLSHTLKIKIFGSRTPFLQTASHFCARDLKYFLFGMQENKPLNFIVTPQLCYLPSPGQQHLLGEIPTSDWIHTKMGAFQMHLRIFHICTLKKCGFPVHLQITGLQENTIYCSPINGY